MATKPSRRRNIQVRVKTNDLGVSSQVQLKKLRLVIDQYVSQLAKETEFPRYYALFVKHLQRTLSRQRKIYSYGPDGDVGEAGSALRPYVSGGLVRSVTMESVTRVVKRGMDSTYVESGIVIKAPYASVRNRGPVTTMIDVVGGRDRIHIFVGRKMVGHAFYRAQEEGARFGSYIGWKTIMGPYGPSFMAGMDESGMVPSRSKKGGMRKPSARQAKALKRHMRRVKTGGAGKIAYKSKAEFLREAVDAATAELKSSSTAGASTKEYKAYRSGMSDWHMVNQQRFPPVRN